MGVFFPVPPFSDLDLRSFFQPRVMFHCVMIYSHFLFFFGVHASWLVTTQRVVFVLTLSPLPHTLTPLGLSSLRISIGTPSYRTGRIDWRSTDFCASPSKSSDLINSSHPFPFTFTCSPFNPRLPPILLHPIDYSGPTFARSPTLPMSD